MENIFNDRRKNYFIKRQFQREFIVKFCSLVVFGAVLSGVIIYVMAGSTLTTTFENSRLLIKSTADFILPSVLLSSVLVIVFIGIAAILVTLFTSHRIAGPLYRIERDIQEVASGNLNKKFNLRQRDEIKALAVTLDEMTEKLRENITEIKNSVSVLESDVESGNLKENLEEVKKVLSRFST